MEDEKELLKLPFVRFAPFMTAGMLIVYFGGGLGAIIFACAAAVLVCFASKRREVILCAAGALCGIALMGAYLRLYCDPILAYSDKNITAEFTVKETVSSSGETEEIIALLELDGLTVKARLICEERLEEGQRAVGVIAFGAHDENRLLYDIANGILLSGEVEELQTVTSAKSGGFDVFKTIRARLSGAVRENISGEAGELALAILFGMDERLSPSMTEKMRIGGASHYTAVSGAHFSVFAAVILGMMPDDRKKTKTLISLLFAPAAVMFFGPSASVIRASVMFFIHSLAAFFMRKAETLNTLCASVTVISIVSPGTVLDAGFAMSVLGIFGAGVVGVRLSKKLCELLPPKIKKLSAVRAVITAFSVSVSAVSCTAPLGVALFGGVSLSGALTSILLVPLITAAMFFSVLLGVTGMPLLAAAAGLSMKLAAAVIGFFGGIRGMWLPLDFDGAWLLAALFAVLLVITAFGSMKTLKVTADCMAVLALFSMSMALYVNSHRSEIRFVGNSSSGAAVVFSGNEAAVLISGGGGGLAESVSRCLRENGAVSISCVAAFDADYSGALAIKELSKMADIGAVYSNEIAKELLKELDVTIVPENCVMSVSGVTIAAASVSERDVNADIAVYNGRVSDSFQSSAKIAVYFSNQDRELPENAHNARREEDFTVKLPEGGLIVSIEEQN